jgi:hypothetical protein
MEMIIRLDCVEDVRKMMFSSSLTPQDMVVLANWKRSFFIDFVQYSLLGKSLREMTGKS